MVAVIRDLARRRRDRAVRDLLSNAGSLVGATAVTSLLGFCYWLAAARLFPPAAVGLAAAAITSMTLLATVSVLGLGTLLIGELRRQPDQAGPLMATALCAAAGAGLALGLAFVLAAPRLASSLAPLSANAAFVLLVPVGASLTAVGLVFDSAVIGLLRGGLQLARNSLFSLGKLLALVPGTLVVRGGGPAAILGTWVLGTAVSLAVMGASGGAGAGLRLAHRPRWSMLRGLRGAALGHHAVNLGLQAPGLTLPLVATITMSAAKTASFYIAWQVAAFSFVTPFALSVALFAIGGGTPAALVRNVRLTVSLGLVAAVASTAVLLALADRLLHLFGAEYTTEAPLVLRIICLGVFPLVVKDVYIALARIERRLGPAALLVGAGAVLEIALAAAGARVADLPGFTAGVVLTECLVAVAAAPAVVRVLRGARTGGG
jgi:O-antigen/teichoic acid export membrane protein